MDLADLHVTGYPLFQYFKYIRGKPRPVPSVFGGPAQSGPGPVGGGSKGLAHIGVLEALEELKIPIDYIAGTSMGSIVGGLYAAGYTPSQIRDLVNQVDWQEAFISWPSRRLLRFDQKDEGRKYLFGVGIDKTGVNISKGAVASYKLTGILTRLCAHVARIEDFDRLPIPYRAVATDLLTGDKVILSQGSLALAMRASMSIPGAFPPYEYKEHLLIDGGVVENLPVETVKEMGADIVIAVNVSSPLRTKDKLNNFIDILDQTTSFQIVKSTRRSLRSADAVITPEVMQYGMFDFKKADELIARGKAAAEKTGPEMVGLLMQRGVLLSGGRRPPVKPVDEVIVARVTLNGPPNYLPELNMLAPFKPGDKVTARQIDQSMQKLYGLGTFEQVNYEMIPQEDGRTEIRYTVKEKPGVVQGRLGVEIGLSSERVSQSQLYLNFRKPNLFFSGTYSDLNIKFGRDYGFALGLTMPNKPLDGLYLKQDLFFTSELHQIYDHGEISAEFMNNDLGSRTTAGLYLDTWGEFNVGYRIEEARYEPHIATIELPEGSDIIAGFDVQLNLDTLDRKPYANTGFASELTWSENREEFGSDVEYRRLKWDAETAVPLASRHTIGANWSFYSSLDTDPPLSKVMFLGGFPGMLGYGHEEFYGNELLRFQLTYRYDYTDNIYLLLAGNTGAVWRNLEEVRSGETVMHYGGGIGLGLNTPIGPLQVTFGVGEEDRMQAYLNFGYDF